MVRWERPSSAAMNALVFWIEWHQRRKVVKLMRTMRVFHRALPAEAISSVLELRE